jgi:hypothetical protein
LEGHIETDHEYMRSNTATVRTTGLYAEQWITTTHQHTVSQRDDTYRQKLWDWWIFLGIFLRLLIKKHDVSEAGSASHTDKCYTFFSTLTLLIPRL